MTRNTKDGMMLNQQKLSQKEHYIQVVKDFLRLLEEKNIPALIDFKEYYEYFNPITTGVVYGLLRVKFLQGKEM